MLKPVYLILFLFGYVITSLTLKNNTATSTVHNCFCQLAGTVDDCSCNVDTVDYFNNIKIYRKITDLLGFNYFRYYKVNLKKVCPFWSDDSQCALKDCSVGVCTEDDVPEGLKISESKYSCAQDNEVNCSKNGETGDESDHCIEQALEDEFELGALNTNISNETRETFETWKQHDDLLKSFCDIEDVHSQDMEYVDLVLNPERYTGYRGKSPHRVWKSIYQENCFKPEKDVQDYHKLLTVESIQGMCYEKRAFYRIISGLHSSINIHLCAEYLVKGYYGQQKWDHNVKEFQKRFDPRTSNGEGPARLKNLYFTYLLVIRAIQKASPYLRQEKYYTGNLTEDYFVRDLIVEILNYIDNFPNHFDESGMFQSDDYLYSNQLKEEFRNHFRNISKIMDCVGCDKCKLWGKLQIYGLGTALKVLFSENNFEGELLSGKDNKKQSPPINLKRQEIVALFNMFGKLSSSIYYLNIFRRLIES